MNVRNRLIEVVEPPAAGPAEALPSGRWPVLGKLAVWSFCCLTLVLLAGCPDSTPRTSRGSKASAKSSRPSTKHLNAAIDYANRMDEFEEEQANVQVAYHLNRWVDELELDEDWSPDPFTSKLPRSIAGTVVDELGRPQFFLDDIKSLMQSVWCASIAKWVSRLPVAGPLADRAQAHADELKDYEVDQLTVALRLFDWTIRSVQLEETIPYPFDPVELTTGEGARAKRLDPPPMRGIPGPGYQTYPWQTLLYGRGDALARARVFGLLARQQGIDVVMLAFPGLTTPPRPRPWVPAVLIRDQLYLFDAELGLAIPGPGGEGIATLSDVQANPDLLDALDVGVDYEYRVSGDELKSVLAMIDASAQDFSRRMQLVQENLTGDNRLVLTVDATGLAERLQKCAGLEDVLLWPISYETTWYQTAVHEPKYVDQLKSQIYVEAIRAEESGQEMKHSNAVDEYFIFTIRSGLVRARHLHFRNQLDNVGDEKGAKMLYLEARVPNAQLAELATSEVVQARFGLQREQGEREVYFQGRLAITKLMVANSKMHSSYWLGLAQYDDGRPQAAVEWFARRTLEAYPNGPWTGGARYNLGRTYEALGDVELAREQYLLDESPQQHGNRLRARYLARLSTEP